MFAKMAQDPTLFLVSAGLRDLLGPDPPDARRYSDLGMLAVAPENVVRLSLARDGKEESVEREASGNWLPAGGPEGMAAEANMETVSSLLALLADLRAERIESLTPSALGPYGLDHAHTVLRAALRGDRGIQKTILLGAPAEPSGVYAMVRGQDVVFVLGPAGAGRLNGPLVLPGAVSP